MTTARAHVRRAALGALVCALFGSAAHAQNMGTALSGPATGDGAAAYYNPAAMALGDSLIELDVGAAFARIDYMTAGGGTVRGAPIAPLLTLGAYTDALHRTVRLGITIGLPATSGGSWDETATAGQVTRYYLKDATIVHAGLYPSLSWTPTPWFTIGAGAQLVYGTTQSEFDKDFGGELNTMSGCSYDRGDCVFPYADPTFAAPVSLNGSGLGVGGSLGVLVRPLDTLEIGVSVQTPVRISTPGTLEVVYPDTLLAAVRDILPSAELPPLNATVNSSMDLPWGLNAGAVWRPMRGLELGLSYRWDQVSASPFWSVLVDQASSPSIVDTGKAQGYGDRHTVRVRGGYQVMEELGLTAFISYQSNTVPEATATPNNLDFNRVEAGLLAQWRISERIGLLLQYSHIFLVAREVRQSLLRPFTDEAFADFNRPRPQGRWSGSADTLRLGLQVFFDRAE